MKLLLKISLILLIVALALPALITCSTSDDPKPKVSRGTDAFSCADCTPSDYLNALMSATTNGEIGAAYDLVPDGQWFMDKPHSSIHFEAPYQGLGANLTGKFRKFALNKLTFDETDPSAISIEGTVWLNTCITGEPLRDNGCLLGYLGTSASYVDETANKAVIKSKSVTYHTEDAGYSVMADLTFLGVTKSIKIDLYYLGQEELSSYTLASFEASFDFNPLIDFGLSSAPIGDPVTVKININLRYV